MVDVREIDGAIAEIENSELTMTRVKNLAALYVVKNQRLADASHSPQKAEPQEPVRYYAASALYVANPKVYNGVMRKLERLQDE